MAKKVIEGYMGKGILRYINYSHSRDPRIAIGNCHMFKYPDAETQQQLYRITIEEIKPRRKKEK
jgi:hypothetical protein